MVSMAKWNRQGIFLIYLSFLSCFKFSSELNFLWKRNDVRIFFAWMSIKILGRKVFSSETDRSCKHKSFLRLISSLFHCCQVKILVFSRLTTDAMNHQIPTIKFQKERNYYMRLWNLTEKTAFCLIHVSMLSCYFNLLFRRGFTIVISQLNSQTNWYLLVQSYAIIVSSKLES